MQLAWADMIHRETGRDVLILAPPPSPSKRSAEEGEASALP